MKGKKHGTNAPKVGSPKRGGGHLFGAASGVQGPGAGAHRMKGSHLSHKQKTHPPGKGT